MGEPLVLAHRGASADAPENTLEAYRLALDHGADVIEVDSHMTLDGVPVLHHSGDLSENTDGVGPIHELDLGQVQRYDAGYLWSADAGLSHPFRGKGVRIPTLARALTEFPKARFNIDIKDRRAARAVRRVIDDHGAADRVLLASWFSWRRAPGLRGYPGPRSATLDQTLAFMLLFWSRIDSLWRPPVDAFQVPERHFGLRVVSPRFIERAHLARLRVHVWTVDDEVDMERLFHWGVDGIVTKRPQVAVTVRQRYLSGDRAGP